MVPENASWGDGGQWRFTRLEVGRLGARNALAPRAPDSRSLGNLAGTSAPSAHAGARGSPIGLTQSCSRCIRHLALLSRGSAWDSGQFVAVTGTARLSYGRTRESLSICFKKNSR